MCGRIGSTAQSRCRSVQGGVKISHVTSLASPLSRRRRSSLASSQPNSRTATGSGRHACCTVVEVLSSSIALNAFRSFLDGGSRDGAGTGTSLSSLSSETAGRGRRAAARPGRGGSVKSQVLSSEVRSGQDAAERRTPITIRHVPRGVHPPSTIAWSICRTYVDILASIRTSDGTWTYVPPNDRGMGMRALGSPHASAVVYIRRSMRMRALTVTVQVLSMSYVVTPVS